MIILKERILKERRDKTWNEYKYDFLVVGAGITGCTIANKLHKAGYNCLVIDRLPHIGGNCYTYEVEGINVHKYGPHVFHTSDEEVWEYITQFATFNNFINSPIVNYKNQLYNLPFNMNTFWQVFGFRTPEEVEAFLATTHKYDEPRNLEQQAINLVGREMYKRFIKGYTEKQWRRPCAELPPSIIKRIPVRLTFDNNYFNDKYQGVPIGGYTKMFSKMLEGIEVALDTNFSEDLALAARHIIWTGAIDELFNYNRGRLFYIGRSFDTEVLDKKHYQGVAVMNFTESNIAHLRITEHKHFEFGQQDKTVITREYSTVSNSPFDRGYPVEDQENLSLYDDYINQLKQIDYVTPCGRLGQYKYLDMDDAIEGALKVAKSFIDRPLFTRRL